MTTELDIKIKSVTAGDIRNMFPRLVGRNSKRLEIGWVKTREIYKPY
ncbi:MAG: hypothetical protein MJ082_04610 [Clostridia bacterium]|nr:hypothetical protein [Clostridia bacterium]